MERFNKQGLLGPLFCRAWKTFIKNIGTALLSTLFFGAIIISVKIAAHTLLKFFFSNYVVVDLLLFGILSFLIMVLSGGYCKAMIDLARDKTISPVDFIWFGFKRAGSLCIESTIRGLLLILGIVLPLAVSFADVGPHVIALSYSIGLVGWTWFGLWQLLSGFVIVSGLLLLVWVATYFFINWTFTAYALVDENLSVYDAFKRSTAIVHSRWQSVFGLVAICGVIHVISMATIAGGLFSLPFFTLVYAHYYVRFS